LQNLFKANNYARKLTVITYLPTTKFTKARRLQHSISWLITVRTRT